MTYLRLMPFAFIFVLSSCGTSGSFLGPPPQEITVEDALSDVGRGLSSFKSINAAAGSNNGLLVDEVTVTLNVTASRSGKDGLVIDTKNIAAPALGGGTGAASFTSGREGKNERSNTVVVKFKNRYTAALNEGGKKGIDPGTTTYIYAPHD